MRNSIVFKSEIKELEELESFIINQLKNEDRRIGTVFKFDGVYFIIDSIVYDLDESNKIYNVKQITPKTNILRVN